MQGSRSRHAKGRPIPCPRAGRIRPMIARRCARSRPPLPCLVARRSSSVAPR
ncbi:Hypothetical protein A7982_00967 [Minicystis rosea]|nr:Hypothetical protein A7982_00967 [Minicystis rosea]